MSFLSMFGIKPKTKGDPRARLPQPQTLVECQVMHGATSSITVEAVGSKTITTTTMPGFAVGKTVILTYANAMGRFRFGAKVAGVRGEIATLAMPTKIDTLSLASGGAQKRASVRLDTTVPTTWRFAPNGKGYGESYRGSLSDVSRTGASLIADREARMHAMVELKMQLSSSSPALVLLGEVMRVGKIEQSGKSSHGLRFHGVTANDDKAIMDFINRRQADRRSRGLM